MVELNTADLLSDKSEQALIGVAHRTGQLLSEDTLSEADNRAAEQVARLLAKSAIEKVRLELSQTIRHAKHLPRDLAMMLAHDVDSVACPFLEVTEVFNDGDWQSLILTVSKRARIAIAKRRSMPDELALTLSQLGNNEVVGTLLENPSVPMNEPVCYTLLQRFSSNQAMMEKLAERTDLFADIVIELVKLVSEAARNKLAEKYKLQDFTSPLAADAEAAAILNTIDEAHAEKLIPVAELLAREGSLKPDLLLGALHCDKRGFVVAALSVLARRDFSYIRRVLNREKLETLQELLKVARIPGSIHKDFWKETERLRQNGSF